MTAGPENYLFGRYSLYSFWMRHFLQVYGFYCADFVRKLLDTDVDGSIGTFAKHSAILVQVHCALGQHALFFEALFNLALDFPYFLLSFVLVFDLILVLCQLLQLVLNVLHVVNLVLLGYIQQ